MGTARNVALDALVACEKQGAWSDGYLKKAIKAAELDGRDAALATRLCFGVLQNRMLLDFYLSQMCTTRLEKLEAPIRNLLRLGAYQILYLDRGGQTMPPSARRCPWPGRRPKTPGPPGWSTGCCAVWCGRRIPCLSRRIRPPGTATPSGWRTSLPGGWAWKRRRPCWKPTTGSPPPAPR